MSNKPLYLPGLHNKIVNPIKIVPSIQKSQSKVVESGRGSQETIEYLKGKQKEKKIVKADIRKHYRTKMCPYGRQCKKRFTCNFAHTEQELRKPYMKRKNPCILFQRGKCQLGSACREYHGNMDLQKNYKYKAKVCEQFMKGTCQKGEVCIFLHELPLQENGQQDAQELVDSFIHEEQEEEGKNLIIQNQEQIEEESRKQPKQEKQKLEVEVEVKVKGRGDEANGEQEEEEPLFISF